MDGNVITMTYNREIIWDADAPVTQCTRREKTRGCIVSDDRIGVVHID